MLIVIIVILPIYFNMLFRAISLLFSFVHYIYSLYLLYSPFFIISTRAGFVFNGNATPVCAFFLPLFSHRFQNPLFSVFLGILLFTSLKKSDILYMLTIKFS